MKNMKILVFSAAFGAGHIKAAESIIEGIKLKHPTAEIHHLDFGEFVSKRVNIIAQNIYIEMIKHTPKLWGHLYYQVDKIPPHSMIQRFLNSLGRENVLEYINSFRPDLIVCTYHVISGILAQLRQEQVLSVPVATVITDYALHSQWVHPGVDLYFVACTEVREQLLAKHIRPDRIYLTGIPVKAKFEKMLDGAAIRRKLALEPDRVTVLVMCGAFGVLDGVKAIARLLAYSAYPVQAIIVCGKDHKLYDSLEDLVENAPNPLIRLGYSDEVEELMAASDLIITKAGGLTVTEALTQKLPLVIFRPIPGQEEENASFLVKMGAGLIANSEAELESVVRRLIEFPDQIQKMRFAAVNVLPGRAAERAVECMLDYCGVREEPQTADSSAS